MKSGATYLVAGAVLLAVAAGVLAYVLLRPLAAGEWKRGKWEVTTDLQLAPAPGRDSAPALTHECLTDEDPAPLGSLPRNCRVWTRERAGNVVNWRVQCTPPRQGAGVGQATFHGDSFSGTLALSFDNPTTGAPERFTAVVRGRRLGDCD